MSYTQNFNDSIYISHIPTPDGVKSGEVFEWEQRLVYYDDCYRMNLEKLKTNGKEYIPSPKDKLFFYPGCDVPRYKVRDWASKKDVSITIKVDNASVRFISNKTLSSCYSYISSIKVKRSSFIQFLDHNYSSTNGKLADLRKELDECQDIFVYLSRDIQYGSSSPIITYLQSWQQRQGLTSGGITKPLEEFDPDMRRYHSMCYITDYNKEILESFSNATDLYSQDTIIKLINADATIIDQDMYKNLQAMLESGNQDDHIVAIEVMANCNINPSLHHLLLLFQQYARTICNRKESNHVNFKSLLKYIGLDRNSIYGIDDDKMVSILLERDQLTMQTIKELAEGVKENWQKAYNSKHFKIKSITVSDEVKEYFKEKAQQQAETV